MSAVELANSSINVKHLLFPEFTKQDTQNLNLDNIFPTVLRNEGFKSIDISYESEFNAKFMLLFPEFQKKINKSKFVKWAVKNHAPDLLETFDINALYFFPDFKIAFPEIYNSKFKNIINNKQDDFYRLLNNMQSEEMDKSNYIYRMPLVLRNYEILFPGTITNEEFNKFIPIDESIIRNKLNYYSNNSIILTLFSTAADIKLINPSLLDKLKLIDDYIWNKGIDFLKRDIDISNTNSRGGLKTGIELASDMYVLSNKNPKITENGIEFLQNPIDKLTVLNTINLPLERSFT